MIQFYGYKKCGTCAKAEAALKARKIAYEFVDITEKPPALKRLQQMVRQSGFPVNKFFNTSGLQYKALKIKDKLPKMTESEALKLLAGNGRLIKRPVVTDGLKSTVGYQAELFQKAWL